VPVRRYLCCALLCALAFPGAASAAGGKPDLVVTKLSAVPAQVAPGGTFRATAKVRSVGSGAKKSKAGFLLSRDRKVGKGDLRLAQAGVRRLKRGGQVAAKKKLRVPPGASGAYRLLACADLGRKVRERREKNNCLASKRVLRVVGGSPPGKPIAQLSFPRPANPLRVSFALEQGAAVSRVIPTTGGELVTEGSDGTVYTLTLPPDSLFGDTKVTMTPLASLGGAPLSGGMIGGVQLLPEGLTLNNPATLSIAPAGPVPPPGQQTGFLAEGDGDDFHLYPLQPGPGLSVKLMHFTLAGAGGASAADRSTSAGQVPATTQAQWEALVADRIDLSREREAAGTPDGDWPNDLKPVHLAYYRDVVRPAMLAALNDDAAVDAGIREGLGWLKKIELYGNSADPEYGPLVDEVYRTLLEILENALARANKACVEAHDLRAIRRIVQVARTAQLLGFDLGPGLDLVGNCVRFELDMDSRLSAGGTVYHVALKDVLLEAQFSNNQLTFAGARGEKQISWLEFVSHSEYDYECPLGEEPPVMTHGEIDANGNTTPTAVAAVTFDIAPLQQGATPPPDDTFGAKIAFNTNETAEHYLQTQTGGCPLTENIDGYFWENFWASSLLNEPSPLYEVLKQGEPGGFSTPVTTFTKVQRGPGEPFLRVQIDRSGAGVLNEHTSVEVFHRPLG
jgi:hypothetical protein